jgi:hypothetical protein
MTMSIKNYPLIIIKMAWDSWVIKMNEQGLDDRVWFPAEFLTFSTESSVILVSGSLFYELQLSKREGDNHI